MKMFSSISSFELKGFGKVFIVQNDVLSSPKNWEDVIGKKVKIDNRIQKVLNIELLKTKAHILVSEKSKRKKRRIFKDQI